MEKLEMNAQSLCIVGLSHNDKLTVLRATYAVITALLQECFFHALSRASFELRKKKYKHFFPYSPDEVPCIHITSILPINLAVAFTADQFHYFLAQELNRRTFAFGFGHWF